MKIAMYVLAGTIALGLSVPAFAGETVTEHETYEKRSMKIEPVPPPVVDQRTTEETETTRTERGPAVVEKHTTVVPGPVVRERKTETETHGDDD